jgi:hypothetical protein
MALIELAEKPCPHKASVTTFTFRVETLCTYISANVPNQRLLRALIPLEQLRRKPPRAILRNPKLQRPPRVIKARR